jgi:hypothetical protein
MMTTEKALKVFTIVSRHSDTGAVQTLHVVAKDVETAHECCQEFYEQWSRSGSWRRVELRETPQRVLQGVTVIAGDD